MLRWHNGEQARMQEEAERAVKVSIDTQLGHLFLFYQSVPRVPGTFYRPLSTTLAAPALMHFSPDKCALIHGTCCTGLYTLANSPSATVQYELCAAPISER